MYKKLLFSKSLVKSFLVKRSDLYFPVLRSKNYLISAPAPAQLFFIFGSAGSSYFKVVVEISFYLSCHPKNWRQYSKIFIKKDNLGSEAVEPEPR